MPIPPTQPCLPIFITDLFVAIFHCIGIAVVVGENLVTCTHPCEPTRVSIPVSITKPNPVEIDSIEEHFVDHIVAAQPHGCRWRYLVCWQGEGPEGDEWLPGHELDECKALDDWIAKHLTDGIFKK